MGYVNAASEFLNFMSTIGRAPDSGTVLSRQAPGIPFASWQRGTVEQVAVHLEGATSDIWFSVNPMIVPESGRGGADRVTGLAALFADLDGDIGKLESGEWCDKVIEAVEVRLGRPASAIVNSGHGRHPYWPLHGPGTSWAFGDVEARDQAAAVLKRFGALVESVAVEVRGCTRADYDQAIGYQRPPLSSGRPAPARWVDPGVFELARVLRVPGTTNHKSDPVPVELLRPNGFRT